MSGKPANRYLIRFATSCAIAFAMFSLVTIAIYSMIHSAEQDQLAAEAHYEASSIAYALSPIFSDISALGSLLEYDSRPQDYLAFARAMTDRYPQLLQVVIAPAGRVTERIPERSELVAPEWESMLFLPQYNQPSRGGSLSIQPFPLVNGPLGIMARYGIYKKRANNAMEYQGTVAAIIALDTVLMTGTLASLEERGNQWKVFSMGTPGPTPPARKADAPRSRYIPKSQNPLVFAASSPNELIEPLIADIPMAGTTWLLAVSPKGGWHARRNAAICLTLSLALATLVALFVALYLNRNDQLAVEVRERTAAEGRLKKLLSEKELLIREVHHRVKNNLAIIESIISLQSRETDDQCQADAFAQLNRRIHSISLIHEKLYRAEDLDRVHTRPYLSDLANFVTESLSEGGNPPSLEIEDLAMKTKAAVSLGLILTELCTNAVKYGSGSGLAVFFGKNEGDGSPEHARLTLRISNSGPPLPKDFQSRGGLGLRLVDSLASQLEGTWEAQNEIAPSGETRVSFRIEVPAAGIVLG